MTGSGERDRVVTTTRKFPWITTLIVLLGLVFTASVILRVVFQEQAANRCEAQGGVAVKTQYDVICIGPDGRIIKVGE